MEDVGVELSHKCFVDMERLREAERMEKGLCQAGGGRNECRKQEA